MKKFMHEFKAFINRGSVMDMAVGIIIGGAFTSIISSLVNDIITPILGLFGGMNFDQFALTFSGVTIGYGKFITAVINFLIMAFVVFLMIKAMNSFKDKLSLEKKEEIKPTTKVCPYCKSEVHIDATKCPYCTSDLD